MGQCDKFVLICATVVPDTDIPRTGCPLPKQGALLAARALATNEHSEQASNQADPLRSAKEQRFVAWSLRRTFTYSKYTALLTQQVQ
jgi:hypothetical protein